MLGSIIGDICGSTYEFAPCKDPSLCLTPPGSDYTDDSVLSIATAEVLLQGGDYAEAYRRYGQRYPEPMGHYGPGFDAWLHNPNPQPYNSCGNGSAMRVGPVGFAFGTLEVT